MIQAGCNALYSEINKGIDSVWNKKETLQRWKEFIGV
jgi:hypothetical protein